VVEFNAEEENGPGSIRQGSSLPRGFYIRPATEGARALLGKILVHGGVSARIVETEAYLGLTDAASHAWRGLTPRTEVIFGPPGHAYVYLIYGIHDCLNVVAEPEGSPGCVLIRAAEPVGGVAAMRKRRPVDRVEDLANGPGKLTRALGITLRHNGADLTRGPLTVCEPEREQAFEIGVSPRIGITRNVDSPLRFFVAGSRFVSANATLKKTC
jgi:DNA-3-methyladenine glycosylase